MLNWHLFVSIYFLIFVAELPDKTAFATLLLATKSRPVPVFMGVALAFLVQTVVAVLFGSVIALLPADWVHFGAGLMFFGFAYQMYRSRLETGDEVLHHAEDDIHHSEARRKRPNYHSFWGAASGAFMVIFIAEWGDLTQVATASLVAKYPTDKLTVFLAALLALWSVTMVAVIVGQHAKRFINPKTTKTYAAYLFFLIGVYFVVTAFQEISRHAG